MAMGRLTPVGFCSVAVIAAMFRGLAGDRRGTSASKPGASLFRLLTREVPAEPEMDSLFCELSKCQTKPILLSLMSPYADSYVLPSRNIPTVMSLFDKEYLDLSYQDLIKVCQSIQIDISKEQIEQVQIDTINQAKGNNFFRHRAGRIGASQIKAAASTNCSLPSQSLIQTICYPELNKVTTKAVLHGCRHEAGAIYAYEQYMKTKPINYRIEKCGIFINEDHPWMNATPDFLCCCDCCGQGCGESKCPLCIENIDFDTYVTHPSTCLQKNNNQFELIRTHRYYYQVLQQLFTTKFKYGDFVVCSVGKNDQMALVGQRISLIKTTGRLFSLNSTTSGGYMYLGFFLLSR